jgi:prevent-host-death family protein
MKFSESVKPISYLKTHASEVIRDVAENQKTLLITHNGEAKVVIQDVKVYEQTQEALALLKILAMNSKDIKKGRSKTIDKTFKDVRKRIEDFEKHSDEVQS